MDLPHEMGWSVSASTILSDSAIFPGVADLKRQKRMVNSNGSPQLMNASAGPARIPLSGRKYALPYTASDRGMVMTRRMTTSMRYAPRRIQNPAYSKSSGDL